MLSWILWDPNPVLFTLPWVNKPIVWYGVFFAFGFYMAYLLLLQLLERFAYLKAPFSLDDVADWDLFREDICYKREGYLILSELSKSTKNALLEEKVWTGEMQEEVIEVLNRVLLEEELPMRGVSEKQIKMLDRYSLQIKLMRQRIALEHQFLGVFHTFKERARKLADGLFMYVFFGTLIGARIGHLLFYRDPKDYLMNPYEIIAVWGGGLSSHGAFLGIIGGLILYVYRMKRYTLLQLIDFITAPVALCAVFIRIGNFFNQEILGIPTSVPWAIVFGHPLDGGSPIPRHPVQLYEAISYFVMFSVLMGGWRMKWLRKEGVLTGLFFLGIFGSRFFLEFYKDKLGVWDGIFPLMTGQLLSIPVMLLGAALLLWKRKERQRFL